MTFTACRNSVFVLRTNILPSPSTRTKDLVVLGDVGDDEYLKMQLRNEVISCHRSTAGANALIDKYIGWGNVFKSNDAVVIHVSERDRNFWVGPNGSIKMFLEDALGYGEIILRSTIAWKFREA